MEYVIKMNLPKMEVSGYRLKTRMRAINCFMRIYNKLLEQEGFVTIFIRNKRGEALRGTIKVEIDGFYYYVELYRAKE